MKLIHDDARYADGRKVCLGDVVEYCGSGYAVLASRNGRVLLQDSYGARRLVFISKLVRLVRRATRREYFEMVGMNAHDYPLNAFSNLYHGYPSDRLDAFEAWIDEPMFSDEGEMQ